MMDDPDTCFRALPSLWAQHIRNTVPSSWSTQWCTPMVLLACSTHRLANVWRYKWYIIHNTERIHHTLC